jgi:hypothetical protein
LTLFSRPRRRPAARRPYSHRPAVERLEGRDAPSGLDTTSLTSPLTDSTTSAPATATVLPDPTTTSTSAGTVAAVPTVTPTAPAPATGPAPVAAGPIHNSPTLPLPDVSGYTEATDWVYTVSGTLTDANPAGLTVIVKVDGIAEPAASVTTVLDGSGHPTDVGKWTAVFGLNPCYSATNATRYCTAVSTNGTLTSALTDFTIEQTPRPHP